MATDKLLLIACSQRKRTDAGLLHAIDRYDGPSFRVLRRYLRSSNLPIDIWILSAEYGLISSDHLLPYYDQRMTVGRARVLHSRIISDLEIILSNKPYKNFLICLGRDYLESIKGYENLVPDNISVKEAAGGLGRKLSILHDWLYDSSSRLKKIEHIPSLKGKVSLRGIEINLTSKQIIEVARKAIALEKKKVTQCQSWYVRVDNQLIAPKWLVSQITGLPVNQFVTEEACRVLTQLGVQVERV